MKLSWAALIIVGALASAMSASVVTAADFQGVGVLGAPDNTSRVNRPFAGWLGRRCNVPHPVAAPAVLSYPVTQSPTVGDFYVSILPSLPKPGWQHNNTGFPSH